MSLFSEMLKEYVKKSRISVSKLAAEAEIDRTLLHKYLSGSRLPASRGQVARMGRAMMLLPMQQDLLLEHYAKSAYGEKKYESFGKIRRILEGMQDLRVWEESGELDEDAARRRPMVEGEGSAAFYGRLQVEDALIQLLRAAAGKDPGGVVDVKILMQPSQESLMRAILRICSRLNVRLEHIVCLDCNRGDNDNISLLFPVLAFEFGNVPYQSYFYYDDIDHHVNQMSLLPNLVLAGDYVFLCNHEADKCLVVRREEEKEFFRREYEKIKGHTERLSVVDPAGGYVGKAAEGGLGKFDLQIGFAPDLMPGIDEKMMHRHLLLAEGPKEETIQAEKQRILALAEQKQFCCYFSERGLRRFLEDGIAPGYSQETFLPFSPEERAVVLNRAAGMAKAGYLAYYMANDACIRLDGGVSVRAGQEGDVSFSYGGGGHGKAVMVKEASISDSLHRFAEFAEESGWFCGRDETVERMRRLGKEYAKI